MSSRPQSRPLSTTTSRIIYMCTLSINRVYFVNPTCRFRVSWVSSYVWYVDTNQTTCDFLILCRNHAPLTPHENQPNHTYGR